MGGHIGHRAKETGSPDPWNKTVNKGIEHRKFGGTSRREERQSNSGGCGPADAPRDVKVLKMNPQSEIHAGQPVDLWCDYSKSNPEEIRYSWKKNGSLVQGERQLHFSSVSPEDSGNYICTVSNAIGETPSQAWGLQVLCEWPEQGAKWDEYEVTRSSGLTPVPLYRCSSEAACVH